MAWAFDLQCILISIEETLFFDLSHQSLEEIRKNLLVFVVLVVYVFRNSYLENSQVSLWTPWIQNLYLLYPNGVPTTYLILYLHSVRIAAYLQRLHTYVYFFHFQNRNKCCPYFLRGDLFVILTQNSMNKVLCFNYFAYFVSFQIMRWEVYFLLFYFLLLLFYG